MMNETLANLICSFISLLGIWFLLFCLYRDYRIDSFRQQMFDLRDRLFDDARMGRISFNEKAYGLLRLTINGFIRFGHKFGLLDMLLFLLLSKQEDMEELQRASFQEQWARAIESLDKDKQKLLNSYRREMNILVIRHTLISSPILILTILPVVLSIIITRVCIDKIIDWCRAPLNEIDSTALAYGEP